MLEDVQKSNTPSKVIENSSNRDIMIFITDALLPFSYFLNQSNEKYK